MPLKDTALPAGRGTSKDGQVDEGPIAYTVAEFARLLGRNPKTVYGWVESGAVAHERIGGSIYIPRWALGCLVAPAERTATLQGGEATSRPEAVTS
jgi:excisionase family DNA binding protein